MASTIDSLVANNEQYAKSKAVHEAAYLVRGDKTPLQPGMCFSIEPGVYLPSRFGVRIEDIVTVTPEGGRRLNGTPHEMAIVH